MSPRTTDALNRTEFLVLSVLADGPRHGYGIAQEIGARTGGEVTIRPGSLYRVLERLVRRGLLVPAEDVDDDADDRRSYYGITGEGQKAVRTEARLLAGLAQGVLAGTEKPA